MERGKLSFAVKWAQRMDRLFVTLELPESLHLEHQFYEDKMVFVVSGKDEPTTLVLHTFKKIAPELSFKDPVSRFPSFVVFKREPSGFHWPRIQLEKTKPHYLHADFTRFCEEGDEQDTNPIKPVDPAKMAEAKSLIAEFLSIDKEEMKKMVDEVVKKSIDHFISENPDVKPDAPDEK